MSKSISAAKSQDIKVTFRKMKFKFGKSTKKLWHNESPFLSYFWSAMSTAFPDGELLFMDSGRYYKDQIKSPKLKQQLDDFVRQEAHHTFQHNKLNALMLERGFPMDKYQGWFHNSIEYGKKRDSPETSLAISMALEHFTANFAEQYMTKEYLTKGMDPEVKALWEWHAIEELEHKAVLFDIYDEIGGGYLRRVITMPFAWIGLLAITLAAQFDMLKQDRKLTNIWDNLRGLGYLLAFLASITPEFLRYFKPSFHPWDKDNRELVDLWYEKNNHYIENDTEAA